MNKTNMEEDIKVKVLEEFVKDYKEYGFYGIIKSEKIKILENLIKRNKELEELLEEKTMRIGFEDKENYIPKSLVEEKIEEIKKYEDVAREQIQEKVIIADSDSLNFGRKQAHNKDIEILKELLKGE